ncbi:hypothetical protein HK101_001999 [Irineochytrium annulatum]|nr:hypothetical protein HK101_001999 [Irineochytrium annulatum]
MLTVWNHGTFLKLYWPFMISGSTAFFLFSSAQVAMQNDPHDKWVNLTRNVDEAAKAQVLKAEAATWYEEQLAKKEAAKAGFAKY